MARSFSIDRYLNVRAAGSPAYSFDGRTIAYLVNTTGIPQVWSVDVRGGEPTQLTLGSDAVRAVFFRPTHRDLIFSRDTGGNERTQLHRVVPVDDGWDFEDLSRRPDAIHTFGGWSHDGTRIAFAANREDPGRFDLFLQQMGEEPTLLVRGPGGYFTAVEWSPDDRSLLAVRTESNTNANLYRIDVGTGEVRHLTPHTGDAQFDSPCWSADGTRIWCASTAEGRDLAQLAVIDAASERISFPRRSDREVESVCTRRNGTELAWLENDDGRSRLFVATQPDLADACEWPLPLGVASEMVWSPTQPELAVTFDGPRHNPNVWLLSADGSRQLTHAGRAGLPFASFVEPELIHYPTFDGRSIPAWWYAPHDITFPPVIVYPHGGPESQTRPNFSALFQFFVARGYAILAPNVRGSSGYGTTFMNLDNIEKRMDSVADLAHAAYWLRQSRKGDPSRVAVYGGSYGGFMVLAALTHYPELWAAGIDVVGICNFVTFLEKTGEWRRSHREKEYGNLREHRAFLERISPLNHVAKIRCPLMVIHGANDPRVPVGEAEQIVAALRERGVPVEYLRYEDEGHGLVKLANRLDAYPKAAAFLDRWLGPR